MSLEEYERHYFQCVRSYPFKKIHNLIVTKIIDHRNFEKVQKSQLEIYWYMTTLTEVLREKKFFRLHQNSKLRPSNSCVVASALPPLPRLQLSDNSITLLSILKVKTRTFAWYKNALTTVIGHGLSALP